MSLRSRAGPTTTLSPGVFRNVLVIATEKEKEKWVLVLLMEELLLLFEDDTIPSKNTYEKPMGKEREEVI